MCVALATTVQLKVKSNDEKNENRGRLCMEFKNYLM